MPYERRETNVWSSRGGKKFGGKFGESSREFGGPKRFHGGRDDRRGGFEKRGGFGGGFGGGRGGFQDRPMFDATCVECGNDCKVPFRPNGSKPVYCSNCFRKDGAPQGDMAPRAPRESGSSDRGGMERELKAMAAKIDRILSILEEAAFEVDEEEMDAAAMMDEVTEAPKEEVTPEPEPKAEAKPKKRASKKKSA